MADSELERAIAALKARYDGESPRAEQTEAAVLRVVQRRADPRRRRARAIAWVPLAAILLGTSAWAAQSIAPRLRGFFALAFGGSTSEPSAVPGPTAARSPKRSLPPRAVAPDTSAASVGQGGAQDSPDSPDGGESEAKSLPGGPQGNTGFVSRKAGSGPQSVRPRAKESAQELYDEAHRLHFVERRPAAALAAWDRYLSLYPASELVLEARYNRSMALVRLGRGEEARASLAPFARGEYGTYRQREAQRLLEHLQELEPAPGAD